MTDRDTEWAGELLGPRQATLVDAVTERLRSGLSPMNEYDLAALVWVARVLGLGEPLQRTIERGPR